MNTTLKSTPATSVLYFPPSSLSSHKKHGQNNQINTFQERNAAAASDHCLNVPLADDLTVYHPPLKGQSCMDVHQA